MNWDRLKQAISTIVEQLVGRRLDYLARYPATVVSQDSGGNLELKPDDSRIPTLHGVPIRLGLPGGSVTVSAGTRVLLAFSEGDPAKPVAEVWESGNPLTLNLTCPAVTITGDLTVTGSITGEAIDSDNSNTTISSEDVLIEATSGDAEIDASSPGSKVRLGGTPALPVARNTDLVNFVAVCPFTTAPHIPGIITATSTKVEAG